MTTTERRHSPRIALKNLAYVNLEPDNGGILVDVSEGGICFRSAVPVPQTSTVRFSFSLDNHRIEASGRLAWSDATRKRGGLRFTSVSPDAQRAISEWIGQYGQPSNVVNEEFAPSSRFSPGESAALTVSERSIFAAPHNSGMLAALSPTMQAPRIMSGFSGGLVAGILISALVGGLFVLQTHRRELGASLIHLGERLGGSSASQPALPEPETLSLALLAPAEMHSPSHAPIPVSGRERPALKPATAPGPPHEVSLGLVKSTTDNAGKSHEVSPETVKSTTTNAQHSAHAQASPQASAQGNRSTSPSGSSSTPPRPSVPAIATAPASGASAEEVRPAIAQVNLAAQPLARKEQSTPGGSGSAAQKFLEVGRFNNRVWVDKTTEKLSQFGFPVSVVQKNNFWKKSYQVLVGPYGTEQEAETVHKSLASRGFTPRSFERGSRDFRMPRVMKVDGANIPVGDCTISWESYLPNAIVKFQTDRTAAVAEGKWVERKAKYVEDAVVFTVGRDGSRTLTEIRFSGMGRALVFGSGNI